MARQPPKPGDHVIDMEHLQIERSDQPDGTVVLILRGEADIESAPALQRALAEATSKAQLIVLDLAGLEFIDSSGISVLIQAQLRATEEDRRLVLRNLPEQTARVFDVAGLASRFTISSEASEISSPSDALRHSHGLDLDGGL
jgi:anti-sigma B factor antagonist